MKLYLLFVCGMVSFSSMRAGELLDAVWAHNLDKVKSVLVKTPDAVNEKDGKGVTALMYAVDDAEIEIVKILIEAKADINAQDDWKNTALMHYVKNKVNYVINKTEDQARAILELLLKAGADQSLVNNDNKTWQDLENASRQNLDMGIARALELKKDTEKAMGLKRLIQVIRDKDLMAAQTILNAEPSIANETDSDGLTPLMHAVGEAGKVQTYVESFEKRDTYLKIVSALFKAGAKLDAQDKRERTAVYIAAVEKRPVAIRLLSSLGADVNIPDVEGNTPLIVSPHEEVTKYLISAQAQLNVQNKAGETALMRAVIKNSVPMVAALVGAGADAALKNKEGKTALDLAKAGKRGSFIASITDTEIEALLKKAVSKK